MFWFLRTISVIWKESFHRWDEFIIIITSFSNYYLVTVVIAKWFHFTVYLLFFYSNISYIASTTLIAGLSGFSCVADSPDVPSFYYFSDVTNSYMLIVFLFLVIILFLIMVLFLISIILMFLMVFFSVVAIFFYIFFLAWVFTNGGVLLYYWFICGLVYAS